MKKFILAVVISFSLVNTIGIAINNTQTENTHIIVKDYYETNDEDDGGT